MPTYDYVCSACGHTFEHFQSMSDSLLRKCPACKKPKLVRQVGAGAAVIFKGSGFYQTDYKAKPRPPESSSEGGSDAGKSSDGGASEKGAPEKKRSSDAESGASGKGAGTSSSAAKADAGGTGDAKGSSSGGSSGSKAPKGSKDSKR